MEKRCSICQKSICRVKKIDDDFYCSVCLDKYSCTKCNRLYDGCAYCHKKLCDCVDIELNMNMVAIYTFVLTVSKRTIQKYNYIITLRKNIMNS